MAKRTFRNDTLKGADRGSSAERNRSDSPPAAGRAASVARAMRHPSSGRRAAVAGGRSGRGEFIESHSVVVEDVALLFVGQEGRRLDMLDRKADAVRPIHMVRAEHHALAEPRIDQPAQIIVKGGAREQP